MCRYPQLFPDPVLQQKNLVKSKMMREARGENIHAARSPRIGGARLVVKTRKLREELRGNGVDKTKLC